LKTLVSNLGSDESEFSEIVVASIELQVSEDGSSSIALQNGELHFSSGSRFRFGSISILRFGSKSILQVSTAPSGTRAQN
jgi:hypothetical protein